MIRLTYIDEKIGKEFIAKAYKEWGRCLIYRPVLENLLQLYIKYGESIFYDEFGRRLLEEVRNE